MVKCIDFHFQKFLASWQAKAPLELIHSDICGPTRTPSLRDKRYFILFVDDYTKMMWVFFISQKSEAFPTFLNFKALAEKQSGHKRKTLRTDHEGEYIYTPFMQYCKENGIQRQLTVSRTPQQNSIAERKNRLIKKKKEKPNHSRNGSEYAKGKRST